MQNRSLMGWSRCMARLTILALLGFVSVASWMACSDDAGDSHGDASVDAHASRCGNGVVEPGEECDNGPENSDTAPDACRLDCRLARCGDDVVDRGEDCDGQDLAGMACEDLTADATGSHFTSGVLACGPDCHWDTSHCGLCGNGTKEEGEECDGRDLGGQDCASLGLGQEGSITCTADCQMDTSTCHTCGDGQVDADEECDDGTANSDIEPDACRTDCTLPRCGDAVTDTEHGESCDDGANQDPLDGCDACAYSDIQVAGATNTGAGDPRVDTAQDGRFVVLWDSLLTGGDHDVYGQRFAADGTKDGTEFRVNAGTGANQARPAVSMVWAGPSAGAFLAVWQVTDTRTEVYQAMFDASGTRVGTKDTRLTDCTNDGGNCSYPDIALAQNSSSMVVWKDQAAGGDYDIHAIPFDSAGTPGSEISVNTHTTDNQEAPAVAAASNGNLVVVWQSNGQDGDSSGIYGQRFASNGARIGSEFLVNTETAGSQKEPDLAVAPDGSFVVVWQSLSQDGSGYGIYAQRFDSDGSTAGSEFLVNTETSHSQQKPAVGMAPDGSFVVVWQSYDQDGDNNGIFGQRFSADASPLGPEFQINAEATGNQTNPDVAVDGSGRFVVVWQITDQAQRGNGVFMALFEADGTRSYEGAW